MFATRWATGFWIGMLGLASSVEAKGGQADQKQWIQVFKRYLSVDTRNPPGNEVRAFPLLTRELERIGLDVHTATVAEDRGNLWAWLRSPRPTQGALILLHHIDVVPIEAESWTVPAFRGTERDGKIYGRGAIDTKVLGVLQLAALGHLARFRARLTRDVVFLAVADEEAEGLGARWIAKQKLHQWKAQYLLDEGGYAIRDFLGGRDIVVIATTQKRVGVLELRAHGEAGHGSRPIPGSGPQILLEAIKRIRGRHPPLRLVPPVGTTLAKLGEMAPFPKSWLLQHLEWPAVLRSVSSFLRNDRNLGPMLADTLTLTGLSAGKKANVIPAEAQATFDVRLLPDADAAHFIDGLRESLQDLPVTLSYRSEPPKPAPASPWRDPLFEALRAAIHKDAPRTTVAPWMLVGTNDSRFFAEHGVRTYGFLPIYLSKKQLDSIHGHDEHVSVAELKRGLRVYRDALAQFLLRSP